MIGQSHRAPGTLPRLLNPQRHWIAFLLVVAAAAGLAFYRLGACGICRGNEAVEAVFVQQMVERGRMLFPSINGGSPMYKPPLFHWTAAALDWALGLHRVTPLNFRLPAALYTVAGVALTMAFAYSTMSIDGAILAGLTLLSAHQYIRLGRMGRVDITLTFFETLALFAFWWWYERLPRGAGAQRAGGAMLYLCAAAIGLAVLAKGPVGAIIPCAAIGIFALSERRAADVLRHLRMGAIALAIIVGASWYLAGYMGARQALLNRQLSSENFGRFFGALGSAPPWFYLGPLLFSSMPASLLAPFAAGAALFTPADAAAAQQSARERGAVRLMAIFWLTTLAFFSVAAYKSRWYLLPMWPAAAVILAWWIRRIGARLRPGLIEGGCAAALAAAAIFNLFYIPYQEARECARYSYRSAAADIRRIVGDSQPLYAAGFADEDFAPLLFYLDRDAPFIASDLAHAPGGYIIVPGQLWAARKDRSPGFEVMLQSGAGRRKPVLLRHDAAGEANRHKELR